MAIHMHYKYKYQIYLLSNVKSPLADVFYHIIVTYHLI